MHEFDGSDTQRKNFGKCLASSHKIYIVTILCNRSPSSHSYSHLALHLDVKKSAHVGTLINYSHFKTIVLHTAVPLKTKLHPNFKVNSSQFDTRLMYTYQNKYQFQRTLIKEHFADLSLLSSGIQGDPPALRHHTVSIHETLDTHFSYLYFTTTDLS
jgi:hypothetical protein